MERISGAIESVKTAANPFVRLVGQATDGDEDGVTHYNSEQVLEAAHQSDYALEWTHKALMMRLDNSYGPRVQYKALYLVRLLLLEGPAAFSSRMGVGLARIHELAHREYADAFKNSIEAKVRGLAAAIHSGCTGGGNAALTSWGGGASHGESGSHHHSSSAGTGPTSTAGKFKSAYHQEQVKEMRNWRKKMHEERNSGTVIQDRRFIDFNSQLTPQKLVESVLNADKKKFAPEETFSFADAVVQNAKPTEVCALMDRIICEPRYSIAQRHKMLQMVEGLVMTQGMSETTGAPSETGLWWRAHTTHLQAATTAEDASNPAKSQQMQAIAKRVLEHLRDLEFVGNVGGSGAGGAGGSLAASVSGGGSFAASTPASAVPQGGGGGGGGGGNRSGQSTPPQQPSQQRSRGSSVTSSVSQQQQQQQQQSGGGGTGTTWAPSFGVVNINPAFAMDSGSNTAAASGGNMFGDMQVTRKTHAATTNARADIFASPVEPALGGGDDAMKSLQEQLQRNMEMMAKLTAGNNNNNNSGGAGVGPQQQSVASPSMPSPAPTAPPGSSWGSSVVAPPPIPEAMHAATPSEQFDAAQQHEQEQQQQQQQEQQHQHQDPVVAAEPQPAAAQSQERSESKPRDDDDEEGKRETSGGGGGGDGESSSAPIVAWAQKSPSAGGGSVAPASGDVSQNASFNPSIRSDSAFLSVPNNSVVSMDGAAQLAAAMANATALQQQQQQAQQQQQQQQLLQAQSSSRGGSPSNVSGVSQTAAAGSSAGGGGGGRSHEDHLLITVLQQQLQSAQSQIQAQNQMINMMQQQIQMLMQQLQKQ